MAELFGIDIAQVVADSIEGAGNLRPGTLVTTTPGTRTPGDLTGGTNPTATSHTFQGFAEERAVRRSGALVAENMSVITVIGASVSPAVVPGVNDSVTIDGETYMLKELLTRDPASAVFEFRAEAS